MRHRTHDGAGADWLRSRRIFRCNGDWYFRTREAIDIGPYGSEFEAAVEASILMETLKGITCADEAAAIVHGFLRDAVKVQAERQQDPNGGGRAPADHSLAPPDHSLKVRVS